MESTEKIEVKTELQPETGLELAVADWVREQVGDGGYPDARAVLKDLFHGGCASSMVSHLIYNDEVCGFFTVHKVEINHMLAEALAELGMRADDLFSGRHGNLAWDTTDPLALDTQNQVILAHFGFETAARALSDRAEFDL